MAEYTEYVYSLELWKGMAKKFDLGSNSNTKIC